MWYRSRWICHRKWKRALWKKPRGGAFLFPKCLVVGAGVFLARRVVSVAGVVSSGNKARLFLHSVQKKRRSNCGRNLFDALTQEKNLESQITRHERDIFRCEREAILAAQKGERAESLKGVSKENAA